ncbi:MAG: helix-turn-helix domain-containing protein [Lachnospiraceae bacterium]|nr:helix-turn-helix domain-containing protein [Lachnospiraceae bacterium]
MKTGNMNTIGARLRVLRECAKISQRELSKEFGIRNSMMSMLESDERSIPIDVLLKYSERFGVSTDWILKGEATKVNYSESEGDDEIIDIYRSFASLKLREVALEQIRALKVLDVM